MVLSQRFYEQLTKLEQMGEWTKLPDDLQISRCFSFMQIWMIKIKQQAVER